MRPSRLTVRTVALVLLVSLTGCIELNKGFPEKRFYSLEAGRQGGPASPAAGTILKIRRFPIAPEFEGRELVYRTGELQYESDFYHEWFVSPGAMFTQQIQNWMAASGLFQTVLDGSSVIEETHLLEGSITALYADVREKTAPRAVLEMRVRLVQERAGRSTILFQQDYRQAASMADDSPGALVTAWNEDLRQVLTLLEEDLRRADLLAGARR